MASWEAPRVLAIFGDVVVPAFLVPRAPCDSGRSRVGRREINRLDVLRGPRYGGAAVEPALTYADSDPR